MKVIIVGAGSAALSTTSILLNDRNFQVIGFTDVDKQAKGKKILGIEVVGTHAILPDLFRQGIRGAVIAIGYDNNIREKYFHQLKEIGFEMINVVCPSAIIANSALISEGVIIEPGCVISPGVRIDRNTILEAGVNVGADTQISDNVSVGIGCNISGGCSIKRNVFLAAGCSVAPFVTIGKNAVIPPGSSVTKNISDKVRSKA